MHNLNRLLGGRMAMRRARLGIGEPEHVASNDGEVYGSHVGRVMAVI